VHRDLPFFGVCGKNKRPKEKEKERKGKEKKGKKEFAVIQESRFVPFIIYKIHNGNPPRKSAL